jgi:hypothetical protein
MKYDDYIMTLLLHNFKQGEMTKVGEPISFLRSYNVSELRSIFILVQFCEFIWIPSQDSHTFIIYEN